MSTKVTQYLHDFYAPLFKLKKINKKINNLCKLISIHLTSSVLIDKSNNCVFVLYPPCANSMPVQNPTPC